MTARPSKRRPEPADPVTAYPPTPWYRDGLRFECTQCGDCCSGPAGFVWVNDDEVQALASAREMTEEAFRDRFTRTVGTRTSLVEYPDGDCIFLDPDTRGCLVYEARPIQCRTWPFWDSTVATPADWATTCEVCPGAGRGRVVGVEEIEIRRREKSV